MKFSYVLGACALLWAACGGDDDDGPNHVEDPQPAENGGVSGGAIRGELNVFVVDDDGEPVAGAAVRVGAASAASPLTGTTDASGLVTFSEPSLEGAQTITASAVGHHPATFVGANGAVVTIGLGEDPSIEPGVGSATVEGTIEGWDDVPVPEANHLLVAAVLYSRTQNLDAGENSIEQGEGLGGVPLNACVKAPGLPIQPACAWTAEVRIGEPTTVYGVILDIDGKGTEDESDDEATLVGFLGGPTVDLENGGSQTGVSLDIVPAGELNDFAVTFPSIPAGLTEVLAIPVLEKGEEWFVFAPVTPDAPSTVLPEPTGAFAGGEFFLLTSASSPTSEGSSSNAVHFTRAFAGRLRA